MSAPSRTRPSGSPARGSSPALPLETPPDRRSEPLGECVRAAAEGYLRQLDGHDVSELLSLVMTEVEVPLLQTVLAHTHGNQSRAAAMLGINRATLRKKLKRHNLI